VAFFSEITINGYSFKLNKHAWGQAYLFTGNNMFKHSFDIHMVLLTQLQQFYEINITIFYI
jgi:hypothetical protein